MSDVTEYEPAPDRLTEELAQRAEALADFLGWLHGQGLIVAEGEEPAGEGLDLDQLVAEFIASRGLLEVEHDGYAYAFGDVLDQYIQALDREDLVHGRRGGVGAVPDRATLVRAADDYLIDLAASAAEKRASQCCPHC